MNARAIFVTAGLLLITALGTNMCLGIEQENASSASNSFTCKEKTAQVLRCDDSTLYFLNTEKVYRTGEYYQSHTILETYVCPEEECSTSASIPWCADAGPGISKAVFTQSFASFKPLSCRNWFYGQTGLTEVSGFGENLNLSLCSSIRSMFNGCINLDSITLNGADVSKVEDASYAFKNCSSLTSIDMIDWDTESMTTSKGMFYGCSSAVSILTAFFDNSNNTDASYMFYGCSSVQHFNDYSGRSITWMSSFDESLLDISFCFYKCTALEGGYFPGINAPKCTNWSYLFSGCTSLCYVSCQGWNTSGATNMTHMFFNNNSLIRIYVGTTNKFVTTNVTASSYMFYECIKLRAQYGKTGTTSTSFNASYTDKTYARKHTPTTPGYFTTDSTGIAPRETGPTIVWSANPHASQSITSENEENINTQTTEEDTPDSTDMNIDDRLTYEEKVREEEYETVSKEELTSSQ